MKSLMLFQQQLIEELGEWCCVSTSMDLKTIHARVEREGFSFVTITLPQFAKDLEKGLERGAVDRNLFQGFSWKGGLPKFMSGFLGLIFDVTTGVLVDNPNVVAIFAVRQICLLFGKIEIPCSTERVERAIEGYVNCERDVRDSDVRLMGAPQKAESFQRIGQALFRGLLSTVDGNIYDGKAVPRVSSGATAERLRGNEKFSLGAWPERLESVFPSWEFLRTSWRHLLDAPDVNIYEPGMERPVRVITVPKTLKAPRIIAIEPFAMQYAQQAILELFEDAVQTDKTGAAFISWFSQLPNQEGARKGSISGDLATLDLSEASDRVSNQLVRLLLSRWPHLARAVDATRSRKADVPGHGVIRLSKFASMGSALCFPVESMVFLTLVFMGIELALNTPVTQRLINDLRDKVRVYGDDIIVPVEYVQSVISVLEDFGLKVNRDKSFWTGKFRESCGKDYYAGHDVSVVRCKREFPTEQKHATEIQSIVSLRNHLYKRGLRKTTDFLDNYIKRIIPFPVVGEDSPALGRVSDSGCIAEKWDAKLQRPLVRSAVVSPMIPESILDDWPALLKFFLKRSDKPRIAEHLKYAGRPVALITKIRWVSAN